MNKTVIKKKWGLLSTLLETKCYNRKFHHIRTKGMYIMISSGIGKDYSIYENSLTTFGF